MQEALDGISARPALKAWLQAGQWRSCFDRTDLSRGAAYANEATIRNVEWIELHGTGELIVTASVQGSRVKPYETSAEFSESRGRWSVFGSCSCPVEVGCKHSAALVALLAKKLAVGTVPGVPRPATDHALATWLHEIETAAKATAATDVKPAKAPNEARFLSYCIEETISVHGDKLQFVLRVANRLKDGTIRIQSGQASADPSKPPQYMVRADILLASLYRQRQNKHGGWGTMKMEGPGWDELLEGALATGRTYFGKESNDYRGSSSYRVVTEGPPETVEAVWETMPDGSARPVLRGIRPGLILLPTVPPRYFDRESAQLGPVESNLPAGVLAAWTRGPVVRAENLTALTERFSAVAGTSLPTPVQVETETRPAQTPRPFLRVAKQKFSDRWSHHNAITGRLFFQYGDSPQLPPLADKGPKQHSALVDGKRVIWPRDAKAERAAATRLLRAGLLPLSAVHATTAGNAETRHSYLPADRSGHPEFDWIDLLESSAFEKLRIEGWIINVDRACGLTARDVADFMPAIEAETDHGIDWFRFDVSYEVDGKRFSLIPLIAHAIERNLPSADSPNLPEFILMPCETKEDGFIRFPAKQLMEVVDQVRHLFRGTRTDGPLRIDRLSAAAVADALAVDSSETTRALAKLGKGLKDIRELPQVEIPPGVKAKLRPYQEEGFRWLQFLGGHGLHGILADDMGLGKTLQTLTHLAAEQGKNPGKPSLIVAPTSVVPNWMAEAEKFVPGLKTLLLHGAKRGEDYDKIAASDVVFTSYPLLVRDYDELAKHEWHTVVLDEAQYIKNPKSLAAHSACKLKAAHRICLSGTPMENHLGELWSLMRFLMPGFLADEKTFNTQLRKPIERDRSKDAQMVLNRKVSPLILRRTKDQVATELPAKTEIIHGIDLTKKQTDLYESVRASMDKRVREAIAEKGLAKSHIIVLDALLKLRQICCHPLLLKTPAAEKAKESAKLDYLTGELLPTLFEEGRRILLFSQFTSMLALIEEHLVKENIRHIKLTGQTKDRAALVNEFQTGEVPIFLISLKAGGTGLNLTAADTVIHYDPWWNPAAENQATDRAHRIGQTKPVFVHKLVCRGSIEERILELQKHKSALVEALLSEDTSKLRIDAETLSQLLAPLA
ncbi:SNF2-related protein [Luteolibacter sp. Populi]|uniref:DEAD/DEAH box helicase n=1 Tax=Luteolibacter sp. Populi TaxID=3230487 RepID=UPI0034672ABE